MATYYVKNSGLDSNTGLSDAQAWQTISKINGYSFVAGDTVSFNKGDTWRELLTIPRAGTVGAYMVYNAYGTGNNPRFLGSNTTTWTESSTNIWKSDQTLTDPYGGTYDAEVFFENIGGTKTWGVHVANTGLLNAEYKWTYSANYIYIYATSDPDTRYTSVEIPQRNTIIDFNDKEYLQFNGIDLHYSIQTGTTYSGWPMVENHGLIIENAHISHIGIKNSEMAYGISGGYSDCIIRHCEFSDCGRRAIDYHLYGSGYTVTNILIEDNYFHDGWHTTGPDFSVGSGSYTASIDGAIVRRNRFYDPPMTSAFSEFIFIQNSYGGVNGATLNNIYIYANIFINSSNGGIHMETANGIYIYNNTFYNHNTSSPSNTFHLNISKVSPGYCTNIKVKNNIFYTTSTYTSSGGCPIFVKSGAIVNYAAVDADYNIYYRYNNSVRVIEFESIHNYLMTEIATLQATTGWEIHGQFASAAMTDPANQDFTLTSSSPAIGAGVDLGIEFDYGGKPYHLTTPSMGAYESFSTYYVKNGGNDSLDGLSDPNAWATISKVNGVTFAAGDTISFKCGSIWREQLTINRSGTVGNHMVFNSYDIGDKPKIWGSEVSSGWTDQGSNIWKSDSTFTDPFVGYPTWAADVKFEVTAGNVTWGLHKSGTGTLTAEYDWTWISNYIYVYSVTNPGSTYTSIQIPQRLYCIFLPDREYITIDGLDLQYPTGVCIEDDGMPTSSNLSGFLLQNCSLGWVGCRDNGIGTSEAANGYVVEVLRNNMQVLNNYMHDSGRRLLTFGMYDCSSTTVSNILIDGNIFKDGYRGSGVGCDVTDNTGNTITNITVRNNTFSQDPARTISTPGDPASFQVFRADPVGMGSYISYVYIYNNIYKYVTDYAVAFSCVDHAYLYNNTFYEITHNWPTAGHWQVELWGVNGRANTDVNIYNNIFYTTNTYSYNHSCFPLIMHDYQDTAEVTMDYNLFYTQDTNLWLVGLADLGGGKVNYNTANWASMKSLYGWQTHEPSLNSNPLFVSTTLNAENFHLQAGSPARYVGTTPLSSEDNEDVPWFTPSSIGAYEYGSNPPSTTIAPTTTISPTTTSGGELTLTIGSIPITDIKVGNTQITKVIRNGITYWQV